MKNLWRVIREALNGALHHAAVRLLVAVLATLGVVDVAEELVPQEDAVLVEHHV